MDNPNIITIGAIFERLGESLDLLDELHIGGGPDSDDARRQSAAVSGTRRDLEHAREGLIVLRQRFGLELKEEGPA